MMQALNSTDTPGNRLRFMLSASVVLLVVGASWWIWTEFYEVKPLPRKVELPYRAAASIVEAFGLFDGEGYREVTIMRELKSAAPLKFYPEEWPVAVRFFADETQRDSLIIIHLQPVLAQDDPGIWLNAQTLTKLPLEVLPDALQLLDEAILE